MEKNFINRFNKNYEYTVQLLDLSNPSIQQQVENAFYFWETGQNRDREDTQIELSAIQRCLKYHHSLYIESIEVYVAGKLIRFNVFDTVHPDFAIIYFEKADSAYMDIFPFMKYTFATHLQQTHVNYINIEQNLGLPGLRRAKMDYHPTAMQKNI